MLYRQIKMSISGINKKLISISSNDRQLGDAGDFEVDLKERYSTQQVRAAILYQAQIPNVFENVRSAYLQNNQLVISENGAGNITVNIPQGQYTRDDLMVQLKTSLDLVTTVGNTVTITYSSILNKMTFSFATLPVQFKIDISTLGGLIGFTQNSANALVITGDTFPNLAGIPMVYIHSPEIAPSHGIDPGRSSGIINLLGAVSLHDAPFGGNAYFQAKNATLAGVNYGEENRNLSTIRIILRTADGTKLPIPDNFQVLLTLKVLLAV
tara:strand:+ start:2187 stop:2990 length:804 start_codon:yes stop_codon:yes gene_type:complete